jgi:hypothetical protein
MIRPPARAQRSKGRGECCPVASLVEVSERRVPTDDDVDRTGEWQMAKIAPHERAGSGELGSVLSGALEETRRDVETDHASPAVGEPVGDPSVAAAEVEDGRSRRELTERPDGRGVRHRTTVGKPVRVEVRVVLVEYRIRIEVFGHGHRPLPKGVA